MPNHILQLDRVLRTLLHSFVADATRDGWQGKERDCVNRFAMGYLVSACGNHHFLQHPPQIGIEMSVRQPSRVGTRPTAPKDLVIWRKPWSTCWDDTERAVLAPLAVIEWKVTRGSKGGGDTSHDFAWLQGFARANHKSAGYSIWLRFREGGTHCGISVARFVGAKQDLDWFVA